LSRPEFIDPAQEVGRRDFHFSASPSSSFDLEAHGQEIRRGGIAIAPREPARTTSHLSDINNFFVIFLHCRSRSRGLTHARHLAFE
jgi:hypothetical protein